MTSIAPSSRHWLPVEPLDAHAFAPFGDVIEAGDATPHRTINEGFAQRFDDLARLDTLRQDGRPVLSVFRARPRTLPLQLRLVLDRGDPQGEEDCEVHSLLDDEVWVRGWRVHWGRWDRGGR